MGGGGGGGPLSTIAGVRASQAEIPQYIPTACLLFDHNVVRHPVPTVVSGCLSEPSIASRTHISTSAIQFTPTYDAARSVSGEVFD